MKKTICDVPGIKVGHFCLERAQTGCTVILPDQEVIAGVDVRGSAPGTREIELLKPECVIINVSRGKLIEEPFLIDALRNGRIKGLGTDVFYNEPLEGDSELFDLENVVMTPHVAGNFEEYVDVVGELFSENLFYYFTKQTLKNVVDRKLGF